MKPLANQSAFPRAVATDAYGTVRSTMESDDHGMTLRQHYAGLAMQGLLSTPCTDGMRPSELAEEALNYVDALIAALQKPTP